VRGAAGSKPDDVAVVATAFADRFTGLVFKLHKEHRNVMNYSI